MDVWPAAGVAAGHDRGERHHAVISGYLHAAQIGFILDAVAVHRVVTLGVAVPDVYGGTGERHVPAGDVDDVELERDRHSLGCRAASNRGADVAALDAGHVEDVGAVRSVAGVRPGGLGRHLGVRGVGDAAGGGAGCARRRRGTRGPGRAGSECDGAGAETDGAEEFAAPEQSRDVEREPLIFDVLAGAVEGAALVGARFGVGG